MIGSTAKNDAADSGNKTCSLSFLLWNVGGLHSKTTDGDFKRYVESFDVVCLIETFVDNSYDLTRHFTGYDEYVVCLIETIVDNSYDLTRHFTGYNKYVSPAVKV